MCAGVLGKDVPIWIRHPVRTKSVCAVCCCDLGRVSLLVYLREPCVVGHACASEAHVLGWLPWTESGRKLISLTPLILAHM